MINHRGKRCRPSITDGQAYPEIENQCSSHLNCVKSHPQWYSMWRFTGVKIQPSKCLPKRTQKAKGNDRFSSLFCVSIKSNDLSKNMLEPLTSNSKMCLTGEGCETGRKCLPMESQKRCTAGPTRVMKHHLHCSRYIISATCTVQYSRNWMTLKSQINIQHPHQMLALKSKNISTQFSVRESMQVGTENHCYE